VRNLEKERSILLAREEKALSKDVEKANRQDEQLREMTAALKEFRSRCNSLEEENEALLSKANKATHEAEMAVESQQATVNQMTVLQEELAKVDEENQSLRDSKEALKAANERIAELEKGVKASAEAPRPGGDSGTTDVLRKELHHQVTHLRSLEHANARLTREITALKKDKANAELLKEEKLALENKLRNMGTLRSKLAQVESENGALLKEKNEWAVFLRDSSQQPETDDSPGTGTPSKKQALDRYSSPASVTKALASARIANLSLEEKVGYLSSLTKVRDGQIQELESRINELQEEVVPGLEKQKEELSRKLEGLQRNQALDAKELQMLKEQVVRC
jgi:mitotic spindle assembly checkpoint protein MAD1